jgi:hypothetical protein
MLAVPKISVLMLTLLPANLQVRYVRQHVKIGKHFLCEPIGSCRLKSVL